MEIQLKKSLNNSLNNYCSELDDVLKRVEEDKNHLISLISEYHGNLQDREYIRSCIYEKILSFHNIFLHQCYQMIEDIYNSHIFEVASEQNLFRITFETKQKLFEFYMIYQYQLNLDYFDKVINYIYNDDNYNFIKTNNEFDNYLELESNISLKADHKIMISYLYQLIKNHGNI
jgi:hypothetical protein